jgi:hypothetical protein
MMPDRCSSGPLGGLFQLLYVMYSCKVCISLKLLLQHQLAGITWQANMAGNKNRQGACICTEVTHHNPSEQPVQPETEQWISSDYSPAVCCGKLQTCSSVCMGAHSAAVCAWVHTLLHTRPTWRTHAHIWHVSNATTLLT